MGNSDKSNGKYGKKQLKNRAKAMGNSGKSNIFSPKYMPSLSEFSHCFCPNLPLLFPEIRTKAMEKFGQKQCENSESGGIYFGQKLWKFWAISRIDNIIFKMYFLDQINILKDLASLCPKFPIYLKILYFRFGRERYEKNCIIGSLI